nr:protein XAP5 circadian timekeeper [Tanacetum cinerariifolium]
MSGMGDGYVGTAQDAVRIRRLEKQREAERKKIQELKNKNAQGQSGLLQFGSSTSEVVRLWRQYYYDGDTLASMDMIPIDQKSVFSSKYGFSFVPFTEFVEDNVKEEQVVDVIRLIADVGDVVHGERKGKKNRRILVELTDIEGPKLKCTLWDAFIDDLRPK